MKTTRLTVELGCDAPGCAHCVLALNFAATWESPEIPVASAYAPEGWRERRTHSGVQHACSAKCERVLIDADEARTR